MQLTTPIVCALATFVLISDHLRTAGAENNIKKIRTKRDEKYTTAYDDFDVNRILSSDRLMKSYLLCLKNQGPCTKEGRELKKYLPDALLTDCSKCSEVQKRQGGTILTVVLRDYRDDFNQLIQIYDPEGIFREKHGYEVEDTEGDDAK